MTMVIADEETLTFNYVSPKRQIKLQVFLQGFVIYSGVFNLN